jgi:hypothetical protein
MCRSSAPSVRGCYGAYLGDRGGGFEWSVGRLGGGVESGEVVVIADRTEQTD